MKRALLALGYVWSAPLGLIGLLLAALFWACGWVDYEFTAWHGGVLWLRTRGPLQRRQAANGWMATTIGWAIFEWQPTDLDIWRHEARHVRQALVLGPLFLPTYALCWLWAYVATWFDGYSYHGWRTRLMQTYIDNYLERDARRAAGEDA